MRKIVSVSLAALFSILLSALPAEGQRVKGGMGLVCKTCKPLRPGVFSPGAGPKGLGESTEMSLFSPFETTYLREVPSSTAASPVTYESVLYGAGSPNVLVTTSSFVSPGAVTVQFESIVDLYCIGSSQQTGFYFAYYVEEDTDSNGAFTCGTDSCGYISQHTVVPGLYGITGGATQGIVSGQFNLTIPFSQSYSFQTTPGLSYRVSVHIWPAHFFVDVPQEIWFGSARLRVIRGPNGV